MEELENQSPFVVFDSKPLNGLRGFVALHLVVYHSLYYCVYNITIYGAVRLFYKYTTTDSRSVAKVEKCFRLLDARNSTFLADFDDYSNLFLCAAI